MLRCYDAAIELAEAAFKRRCELSSESTSGRVSRREAY
jgi:hypothetical protein